MDWSKTCSLLDLLQVDLTTFLASRARDQCKAGLSGGGGKAGHGGGI